MIEECRESKKLAQATHKINIYIVKRAVVLGIKGFIHKISIDYDFKVYLT